MNNRKWSRIIAMLLAVMLVFCDSNVTYAVESMTEAQTEDPAAAQAAADAEAARQAEEAQAAAEAEAARQAAEAQAAADAEAARQAEEAQTAAQEATDAETEPQTTPSATGSLTLKTEEASTQKDGEPARLKVTYELSADSSVDTVETRLYAWNKNAGYPQFKDGKFTDPETKREFQLKTDKDGLVYVEYILKKGESFTEEFEFIDTTLEVGTQITFDVAIGANGVVPANCSIQSTTAKVTYALPDGNGTATEVETESNAPESAAVENTVAFQSAEGASVTVDGADVTNGTAMAKDGKIVFTVTPAEGYEVTSILVDGTIPARTNDETPETNDYIIEGIQTDSTVVVISTQAAAIETESETEAAESETVAETESETETAAETESETETVAETETETIAETESEAVTEAETETETENETEVKYGTNFSYEDENIIITAVAQPEAKLPENAVLKADPMPEGSIAYEEAVSMVEDQIGEAEEGQEASYVFYDVYFEVNGQRVEPADGLVEVSMNFKTPVLESVEDEQTENVTVIHIDEKTDTVQNVTDQVEMTDNGGVSSVGFTTDSFSPMGIRKIAKVAPSNADPNKNIATIAKECNATLLVDGKPYVEGTAISRDAVISLSMTYSYKDEDGKRPTKDDPNGWYYTFENFDASKLDLADGDKALEGGITVSGGDGGTYVFVPSENRVYFNYKPDYIANRQNLKGNFSMDYKLNKEEIAEEKEITINLGKHTYKIPLKDTDVTGKKDYVVDENGNMIFTISLTAEDAEAKNVVVTDKLTGDLTFKEGSFNVQLKGSTTKIPLKPTITTTEGGQTAVITLPDDFKIPYGQTAEITYIVTPKTGSQATGGSNEASWSWGSTDSGNSGKTDVDVKFDKDRLSKTAESAGSNRFKYTIDVNKLNETLAPDSSTGTLTLTDVIRLSESENNQGNAYISLVEGSVKVFDKNGKDLISQKKASYSYDQGTNTLKFTVPDGQALKIEYVISVSGVVNDTVSLDNTVNLEGKNIIHNTAY